MPAPAGGILNTEAAPSTPFTHASTPFCTLDAKSVTPVS